MIPRRIFVFIDACLILLAFVIAHVITPRLWPVRTAVAAFVRQAAPAYESAFRPGPDDIAQMSHLVWLLFVIAPAVLFVLLTVDAYGRLDEMSRTRMLLSGPFAATIGMSVAALVIFLLRIQEWSRVFLFAFTALMAFGLTSVRAFIRSYHRWRARSGYYRRHILLAGPTDVIPQVMVAIGPSWPRSDIDVIGYLDSSISQDGTSRPSGRAFAHAIGTRLGGRSTAVAISTGFARPLSDTPHPDSLTPMCLGCVADIEEILLQNPVHEVVAALRNDDSCAWVADIVRACDHAGVSFRLVPEVLLSGSLANLVARDSSGGLGKNVPSIVLAPRAWDVDALHIKRLIDVVLSTIAIVVLAPVFVIVAVLVRLSSRGPIFHRSNLVGQNGTRFSAWKFRTMVSDANALQSSLQDRNEMTGPVFKIKNDPRITPVGRWLRKFSLDELPQLFSVLKGDQSLVGPRAASSHEFERYEFWQMRKISVKPGITCFWQIRGRNAISNFNDWIKMDLEYIDNWSLWLDLKILVRTLVVVVKGTGY